jgi:hypothetical protein
MCFQVIIVTLHNIQKIDDCNIPLCGLTLYIRGYVGVGASNHDMVPANQNCVPAEVKRTFEHIYVASA